MLYIYTYTYNIYRIDGKKCKHTFNVRLMKRTRISTEKNKTTSNSKQQSGKTIVNWHLTCIRILYMRNRNSIESMRCHSYFAIQPQIVYYQFMAHDSFMIVSFRLCVGFTFCFSFRFSSFLVRVYFFFPFLCSFGFFSTILPSFYWILVVVFFIHHRYLSVPLIRVMFPPYFRGHIIHTIKHTTKISRCMYDEFIVNSMPSCFWVWNFRGFNQIVHMLSRRHRRHTH